MAAFGGWRLTRAGILFVIGILVLGGLVTGGVLFVKHRGEVARRDQAVKIAEQNLKDQSKDTSTTTPDKESGSDTAHNGANSDSATPAGTTTDSDSSAANSDNGGAHAPAELPATGPDSLAALGNLLAVTILALSGAFYVSSLRDVRRNTPRL